ncbi:RNA recognition motif domain-containing protein [Streptomyces sp. G5(2025)]|uniref:RNA recognition motif domain-containing protein n=1 Tax=Streptomyces sp. G5(2025) TaxID=3406628 RepID=UPI003C23904B
MGNKVFVSGLPWAASEDSLAELFSQFGEVIECAAPRTRRPGEAGASASSPSPTGRSEGRRAERRHCVRGQATAHQ